MAVIDSAAQLAAFEERDRYERFINVQLTDLYGTPRSKRMATQPC
jgi:hypothetical protein